MRFRCVVIGAIIGGLALSAGLAFLLGFIAGPGTAEYSLGLHSFSQLIHRILDGAWK